MFMRMIYDERLAQAAYVIGCQRTGEAIVIDPERDIDRYITLARDNGLTIVAVAETHIHADFLSGARELAEAIGARVYVSDEGDADWKYQWLDKKTGGGTYDHQLLKDGDSFMVGNIRLTAVHTPGHTPEHMSYLVTDTGSGATEPMALATGDFVFVGDLGRPDLLETAAGQVGAKEPSARVLYNSAKKFLDLPDYLQIWPAHGAGSACGKALGAVPQSTVGYEKRVNPALHAMADEDTFVSFILQGQPEPPMYFARMKRDNKLGPRVLGGLPEPSRLTPKELAQIDGHTTAIIDTRPWAAFKAGHPRGALYAPLDSTFHTVAGSYIDEDEQIVLIAPPDRVEAITRDLVRIGLDKVIGYLDASDVGAYESLGGAMGTATDIAVDDARERLNSEMAYFLDVRRADEFAAGHMPTAHHAPHTRLPEHLDEIPRDKHIYVNCRSGGRSSRAVSYLQRQGYEASNIAGGYLAWEDLVEEQPAAGGV